MAGGERQRPALKTFFSLSAARRWAGTAGSDGGGWPFCGSGAYPLFYLSSPRRLIADFLLDTPLYKLIQRRASGSLCWLNAMEWSSVEWACMEMLRGAGFGAVCDVRYPPRQ